MDNFSSPNKPEYVAMFVLRQCVETIHFSKRSLKKWKKNHREIKSVIDLW